MKITFWGTRGSLASPGPETKLYGGNTSCVQITGPEGTTLILDAGTGLMRLGNSLLKNNSGTPKHLHILLTHLHMDHLQGLGFFGPLYNPQFEVELWGPASTTMDLKTRLNRYMSPPLFPVHLRDLPCKLRLKEVPRAPDRIGEFEISTWFVCHPGPTVGYKIKCGKASVTYLPDHEPALGAGAVVHTGPWTSGFSCALGSDLLIHDAQYTQAEYSARVGWGHSSIEQAFQFAALAEVKQLVPFHHDPFHNDAVLDQVFGTAIAELKPKFKVTPAKEGQEIELAV